ncbi:SusC/RagA family TonB-linked outer membrane protein [Marinifilum sp. JC070]|uniref:SusC/RagA family TonB-linked outer membrane protein n=2 Tax=Marinifilum caeruleilacunae TaxID=2499076 RepID=A0ABX1WTP3_9BACT|nr:SusC/RagA family TonB-linked outer membrane protein [Marinifilum caeruleilacunae]
MCNCNPYKFMKNSFGIASFFGKRRWKKTLMRMKLLTMLMLVGVLQLSANVRGQNALVNMSMHDANLVEFFSEIADQTDYEFLYNHDLILSKETVSLDANQQDLKELLEDVLHERELDYELDDNVIIISERQFVAPSAETAPVVQEKTVKGKVADDSGAPLPGVSIVVKGTSIGTATDIDGNYTLTLEEGQKTLVFSFIGMLTQEVAYKGQEVLNVTLFADTEQMAEVVVTGYQTIAKERATGSFQIVNSEDLDNVASLDITQKLVGVASGVKVDKDGQIVIRGQATLSAETQPLIVVNGLPWMGQLSEINSEDVEQISVLKDAASTSIYGVRGANGVIVITTKSGKTDGKLVVNYTNSFQVSEKPKLDDLDLLNSEQFIDLEWESYQTAGLQSFPWYNYKSEVGEIYNQMQSGVITEAEAQGQLDVLRAYDNRKDIEEEFFRREMTQKHTMSFAYGSDKNQFYASLSYDENKTKWDGIEGNNIAFNLNDQFKFNKLLKVNLNAYGNFRENKNNGSFASMTRPYVKFKDENGNYLHEATGSWDNATRAYHESLGLLPMFYNQIQEKELKDDESRSSNIATNVSVDLTPTDWLTITASLGYSVMNGRSEDLWKKESYRVRNYVNRYTDMNMNQVIPNGDIFWYDDMHSANLTKRLQMSIKKSVKDFDFSFNAGMERNKFESDNNMGNVRFNYHSQRLTENVVNWKDLTQGFVNATFGWSSLWQTPMQYKSEDRYQSTYFIGNVSYKGKYDLSGSWRLDETNLFGQSDDYQDQPSWSVGAKWNVSQEDFFKVDWINSLALKGSFGLAGNIDKSTSPFLIGRAGTDYFTGNPSLSITNPENPLLSWEETYTTNIGVDYALFGNRINGSIEFYNRLTKDVLAQVNVDPTTGFGGTWDKVRKNNGEILNRGIDLNVHANIVKTPDFRYDVNFNFSYNYNELKKVDKPANNRTDVIYGDPVEGEAVDFIYGYRNAGLDADGEPQVYNRNGEVVLWRDMTSFDIEDGKFFGRTTAPIYGSLNNHFTYKNFSADIFFLYDFGHYAPQWEYPNPVRTSSEKNVQNIVDQRWRNPGDELKTKVPRLDNTAYSSNDRISATWNSDFNIDKADVIQLKSINLAYDFSSLIKFTGIESLKLKFGVENLWHWTAAGNDRIYDTRISREFETDLSYERSFDFPKFRTFTFGMSMRF